MCDILTRLSPSRFPALLALVSISSGADFPETAKRPSPAGLPNVLVALDGTTVTTKEQWFSQRRPELKALFEHYMYGTAPVAPSKVTAVIEREDRNYLSGKATKKEL